MPARRAIASPRAAKRVSMSRFYRSFEDFARDEIAPGNRVGWSMDELEIESTIVEDLNLDDEDEDYEED